jgi:hypothetical protein
MCAARVSIHEPPAAKFGHQNILAFADLFNEIEIIPSGGPA